MHGPSYEYLDFSWSFLAPAVIIVNIIAIMMVMNSLGLEFLIAAERD